MTMTETAPAIIPDFGDDEVDRKLVIINMIIESLEFVVQRM